MRFNPGDCLGRFWFVVLIVTAPLPAATYVPSGLKPPAPLREFRGAWAATVANINWPSKPGLPTDEQKAELSSLLDLAAKLRLNAFVLQVRPACDALYASPIEPWSEYLTGQQGRAPEPSWDPLEFAVSQAHERGIELHAWFNPYRARHMSAQGPAAANHISRTQPALVRTYGRYLWLDPGESAVREHSLQVILDVVRRYDVDGVHLDDYFYPYREKDADGKELDFPDEASWQRYQAGGGSLARDDWRRDNVNQFIRRLYETVHAEKPWVKVGLSPFGIWRPGNPPQIRGLDQYAQLYADARLWLNQGWVDYFTPQLYWQREPEAQSFTALLAWWAGENSRHRHLWPGLNTTRSRTWKPGEISEQIRLTRQTANSQGAVHWNIGALARNTGQVADSLAKDLYAEASLVPASPWLDSTPPATPKVTVAADATKKPLEFRWQSGEAEAPAWWVVQVRRQSAWSLHVFPMQRTSWSPGAESAPEAVALYALDRAGNLSEPVVLEAE